MSHMEYPLVTIMIPTYNQADIVHRAIESALAQDYSNLEVVVSDDGSPDNTSEVVRKYMHDARFRYFRNDKNLGRVRNYKKCLEEYATGEWVVNCDGDDYYTDNRFISEMMDAILHHQDKNIVFAQGGHLVDFIMNKDVSYSELPPISNDSEIMADGEFFWSFPDFIHFSHLTAIYRRELAVGIDFYRSDISSSDRESFLRLALHGDVLIIKKIFGAWVQHGFNFSQNLDFQTRKANLAYILNSYKYALERGLPKSRLNGWRKKCLIMYFKDWLSKIALHDSPLKERILMLNKILNFAKTEHQEVWTDMNFYKTIFSLPYKLI